MTYSYICIYFGLHNFNKLQDTAGRLNTAQSVHLGMHVMLYSDDSFVISSRCLVEIIRVNIQHCVTDGGGVD